MNLATAYMDGTMPATDFTQNKTPAISAELMASAKSGCTEAMNELWVMLMPVARNAAMHHCVKFCGMRGSVDDIAQELLCHVPRLVEKFPEGGREDILGWFRFCLRRKCLNIILNHPGYVRARNSVNILSRIVQPEDLDESEDAFNFDALPAEVECAICRKPFCPDHAEHILCSRKCRKIRDGKRRVVSVAFSECVKILDRLQSGTVTSMDELPDINCHNRVAQLRAIGYRIKLSEDCMSMQLQGTPFDPIRLGERLALLLYGGTAAVADCEICGKQYEFSALSPKLVCGDRECRLFGDGRSEAVLKAIDDCRKILDRLRDGSVVGVEELAGIDCLHRVPQLRSLGYEIELSSCCDSMRLIKEPNSELPLIEQIERMYCGDTRAIGGCEVCGGQFYFSPKRPKLTCGESCTKKLRRRCK